MKKLRKISARTQMHNIQSRFTYSDIETTFLVGWTDKIS